MNKEEDKKVFIEIGACDFGTLNDLGKSGNWKGVIVEPVKKYLDNLERHENVTYLNAAIDTKEGERELWLCSSELCDNDRDYTGMSSFHKWPAHGESVTVPTLTYTQLIEKCGFDRVDYLKIDTEGHDYEILKTVDFSNYHIKPKCIKVEYKHCGLNQIKTLLEENGYLCDVEQHDVWAILK